MLKKNLLFYVVLFLIKTTSLFSQSLPNNCSGAPTFCGNTNFSISANGSGGDFTTLNNISNPTAASFPVTPATGSGCLMSGEINSNWFIINIQSNGNLQFSLAQGGGVQIGFYDWIMWPYNGASTCSQITANTLAPVRCCYNSSNSGGTGLAAVVPAGGNPANYGSPLNVLCGQKYIVCMSNYSGVSATVPLQFFGTASVSCLPIPNPLTVNNPSICLGSSATLTVSGLSGTTYTWVPPGSTGSSVAVSPIVTSTYTVNGLLGLCTSSATGVVTVNSTPTITASGPPSTVCANSSTTLSASGASTYTWFPGAIVGSVVSVSPSTSTTYTVIGSNGTCTSSAFVIVTVAPGPTVVTLASPTSICAGQSSFLLASGALSYTWQPGGANSPFITVTPTISTTYSVTGINSLGCTSTSTVAVSVLPTPILTITPASSTICTGGSINLSAAGATGYTWQPGGANTTTVTFSPLTSTTYTLYGSNGTCTSSLTSSVTVLSPPIVIATASSTNICKGSTATLTASGATSYTWNPGALTGSNVSVTPTINTIYTVIGSNGGCSSTAT
ncbi:MAG: hypothetical protein JSU07_09660, partial [Bacteroidetes bacterium]|nr:hypothetical protein [Bacteroidota bacterium]